MKRSNVLSIAGVVLVSTGLAWAESIPLRAVNKANEVIDAAIQAHGGAEAIDGVQTFTRKTTFKNSAVGQSLRPGQPWDQNESQNFAAIDLENEIYYTKAKGEGGGFTFSNATLINGEDSYQMDFRRGTAAPIAQPNYDNASGPTIRVTPVLLMKQLMARRQTSHWLGVEDVDGRPHDIITLVMEVGPALSMYFDQETHMLNRMERVLPPFGQVEYLFQDYAMVDGVAVNANFTLLVNGDVNILMEDMIQRVNVPIDQYVAVPSKLQKIAAVTPNEFGSEEIDEGVFLVGGNGAYSLFVEMDDHIVAIGGTQGVADRNAEILGQIEDKPIRYGVLTHHHNDHIPGTADYAAEGITVITFEDNAEVVRAAAGGNDVELQFVEDRLTLGSGDRRVELYNIGPTPHVENMLIAYLPKEGIIFEADHFPQPQTGPMGPAVPATKAFARALDELGLRYNRIVGAHSPRIGTPADLQAMLEHPGAAAGAR